MKRFTLEWHYDKYVSVTQAINEFETSTAYSPYPVMLGEDAQYVYELK